MSDQRRSQSCRRHGREDCPLCFARVEFWCCPVHVGAPHRVEWREDIAYCLTDGCGRTSAAASSQPLPNHVTVPGRTLAQDTHHHDRDTP